MDYLEKTCLNQLFDYFFLIGQNSDIFIFSETFDTQYLKIPTFLHLDHSFF